MNRSFHLVMLLALALGGCAAVSVSNPTPTTVALESTEGCECVAPCPCVRAEPTSFDGCRALKFYKVESGVVDGQDLRGLVFVAAISGSPKEMFRLRDWRGSLYVQSKSTPEQRAALRRVANSVWGGVYRGFEPREAEITYRADGESREATIGAYGRLLTRPLLGTDGQVKRFPTDPHSKSGVSVRNHYDDGKVKWDLSGRSARIAPMIVVVPEATK